MVIVSEPSVWLAALVETVTGISRLAPDGTVKIAGEEELLSHTRSLKMPAPTVKSRPKSPLLFMVMLPIERLVEKVPVELFRLEERDQVWS